MRAQQRMPISDTMKTNIDVILNSDYEVGWGTARDASGINITRRPRSSIMDIECKFHGRNITTGEDFELTPLELTRVNIAQDFEEAYEDDITIVCTFTPEQLLTLLDNYRNLYCTLLMKEKDPKGFWINHEDVLFDETFRVVIKDKELRKRVSKQALIPDNNADITINQQDQSFSNVEIQLIKDTQYLIRKKKFNFQARRVTVKDVILFLAQCCDVKNICITEPDNKTIYTNMIMPPQQTFISGMQHLQDYYGVYEKGLGYYFTNDILYIYPLYETKPTTPESAHLYYSGQYAVIGNEICHAFSDEVAHVVITSTPVIRELVDGGVENIGNALLFHHADRIVDLYSTIGEGDTPERARLGLGDIDIKEPNTSLYGFKEDNAGIMDDVYTNTYKFDFNNQYRFRTEMHMYRRLLIGVRWNIAQPCIFKPGYLLHWHFDGEDISRREQGDEVAASYEYQTRDGICQRVTYDIRPIKSKDSSDGYAYSCNADMVLSVEFEQGKKTQDKPTNTSAVTNTAMSTISQLTQSVSNLVNDINPLNKVKGLFDLF